MSVPADPAWPARLPLISGILALLLLVGGLGGWSLSTTLSGAVIASGALEVETNRQVIQHPDGGVVAEILVRDGDSVAAGDVLLRLDDTRLQSELTIVEGQLAELAARRARLAAERSGAETIAFPETMIMGPETAQHLAGEEDLFQARREALEQRRRLLTLQNEQIAARIEGIGAQLDALIRQRDLVAKDLEDQKRLFADRLTPASNVSALEREAAGVDGQIGRLRAEIAELEGQITANEIAWLQIETARREEATTAERDLQFSEIELAERRIALLDRLSRMDLRAPMGGLVYDSRIFAEQAVVQPADPVMFIIPQDQPLIVAARVESIDIDEIHVGQEVALRFSAFDQAGRLPAEGSVVRVSADANQNENTGATYYTVDIRPASTALSDLRAGEALLPGMPVQAFIRTRDRTAFAYLTEPFTAFFEGAFRE